MNMHRVSYKLVWYNGGTLASLLTRIPRLLHFLKTMSIHVICSGCLKRFQVGIRFAGMKGPCPNCGAVISIPKETIKIHETDDAESKKEKKQRVFSQPIQRFDLEFDPAQVKYCGLGVLGVLLLTFLLGCIPMWDMFRSFLGILGLCLVAFPLSLFGYHVLRDREQIFAFTGEELYRWSGIVAAGYVILWISLEFLFVTTRADTLVSCLYFAAIAILATLLAYPIFALKLRDAFLHFCFFALPVIFLRFLIGLGWFWESGEAICRTAAPPPPFLPGM